MKNRAYPKYKPSGVEWLGEVPEHWEVKRTRFMLSLNPSKQEINHLDTDTELSFLPMEAVGEDGSLNLETTRPISEVSSGYTYFAERDVTFAKITPCFENGKGAIMSGLINSFGFGTTELTVLRPGLQLNDEFLYYITISRDFRKNGEAWMYGAGGQKRVPDEFVKEFRIAFPPLSEQQAIATFLDRETGRVDALVAKKERLIELLREKRSTLISHAVTKGLDPSVKLKPSGVDWLGEVPENWDVKRLVFMLERLQDGTHFSPENDITGDFLYITAKNIKEWGLDLSEITYVSADDHRSIYSRCPVKQGDVLYIKDGATAGIATVNRMEQPFSMLSSVAMLRPKSGNCSSSFLAYHLNAREFKSYVLNNLVGGAMTRFTLEIISKFWLISPPFPDQQAIATFLDRETGKIDALIAKVETAITKLKEYRTALISAAVTGKIDVREAA